VTDLLVVKAGSTLEVLRGRRGDYEDWIAAGMGVAPERMRVLPVAEGAPLPDPRGFRAVVVTGSSAMVSQREPWSERAAGWLRELAAGTTPLLGICYGHQLLAHGLGGRVGPNPRGRQMGTTRIRLLAAAREDALLRALPESARVQVTHREVVLELPPGARLLAHSPGDPHHAFAVGERAWGVQFHPEFDADVMRAYLEARRELLREEGIEPEPLERGVGESPEGAALLRRFAQLAGL
jgi:GMP synthase (glutamine-hydrolysing)